MEIFTFGDTFKDKSAWDGFVKNAGDPTGVVQGATPPPGGEYLQSWEWAEIWRAGGQAVKRFGLRDKGKIVAAAAVIKASLPLGQHYWYAPRGPVFSPDLPTDAKHLASYVDVLSRELRRQDPRAIFWRLEPAIYRTAGEVLPWLRTVDRQPAQTLFLDLSPSEAELLAAMGQKTRYNIRLAEKKNVRIKSGQATDFPEFWRLLRLTGERDGFRTHTQEHYRRLLTAANGFIRLRLAEYEGRIIAAGLFCFWGGRATYLHGASDNEYRNVMAPYLLQWSVIKEAKQSGVRCYDFYGLDERRFPGVTRFKLGFGGERFNYPGTYDLVFRPSTYRLYDRLRRLKRSM
ncbi:MAG: peptidoglycan bridge formation glycyltransferase FemA/FemB family protein [Patescibacteria group bacterium]